MKILYLGKTVKELALTAMEVLGDKATPNSVRKYLASGGVPKKLADIKHSTYYGARREYLETTVPVPVKDTLADLTRPTSDIIRSLIHKNIKNGELPAAAVVLEKLKEKKVKCNSSGVPVVEQGQEGL